MTKKRYTKKKAGTYPALKALEKAREGGVYLEDQPVETIWVMAFKAGRKNGMRFVRRKLKEADND